MPPRPGYGARKRRHGVNASNAYPPALERVAIEGIVRNALLEDLGRGDVTTDAIVPVNLTASGRIESGSEGVVAGLPVVEEVFRQLDEAVRVECAVSEGTRVCPSDVLATIEGPARSILKGERVALNFLQRMSGIATLTARFVEAVAGTRAFITDTRKTTPGLRILEKYAVRVGGGLNHRMGLSHSILIKDNHIVAAGSIADAVARATRAAAHIMTVAVECDTLEQVAEALDAGADILLLDNMTPEELLTAVRFVAGRAVLEASGGITLDNVAEVARTGVDCISIGALTHSAPALDIRLTLELDNRT